MKCILFLQFVLLYSKQGRQINNVICNRRSDGTNLHVEQLRLKKLKHVKVFVKFTIIFKIFGRAAILQLVFNRPNVCQQTSNTK